MMDWLREFFFGNWRNKAVALFFAVTIWVFAYQSERQVYRTTRDVQVVPASAQYVITKCTYVAKSPVYPEGPEGTPQPFDEKVKVTYAGPRKQIEKLRDVAFPKLILSLPPDKEVFEFRQEDFGFPRESVEIAEFIPESLSIRQEPKGTATVTNLAEKIAVLNVPEGYEVASKEVIPRSQTVVITGPRSLVERLTISLNVSMDFADERFDGKVGVTPIYPDEAAAEVGGRGLHITPSQVQVTVALRARTEVLPVDAVRITFRLPLLRVPVKIVLDDAVGDTIPVEFYGRKDEILRLKDRLREQPGFSLGVRVPQFDREQGGQFTFTEDSLELYGFPGVQIRQHESRRKEKKTAWSYTIIPVKEESK